MALKIEHFVDVTVKPGVNAGQTMPDAEVQVEAMCDQPLALQAMGWGRWGFP